MSQERDSFARQMVTKGKGCKMKQPENEMVTKRGGKEYGMYN